MHSFIFKHEKQVILTNILYVRNMLGMFTLPANLLKCLFTYFCYSCGLSTATI